MSGSAASGFRYEATLIHAGGRRMTVPMPAEEGEPSYRTFRRIKGSPMAGEIYRRLVMPMLQGMLEGSDP